MQSNSESSVTGPKPPPPPTHYPPYREQANVRANESRWKEIYGECVAKGAERLQLMQEPIRQPRPRSIFIDEYDTEVVNNSHSPTRKALQSLWRRAVSADTQHGYQNTPLPSEGLLRSWQNASTKGEPLTNTDVYFYQYLHQHEKDNGPGGPPPQLRTLRRQQAGNQRTTAVYNRMRWDINAAVLPEMVLRPQDDSFKALLGSPNGTAACYLIVHYGDQLGISQLVSITLTVSEDLIFAFE